VRGVSAIHRHGLAHRDLKPENCMVEAATGRLLIIDFGLSKRQQSAVTLG
jgi:serine/threonine protein kinase